MKDRTFCKFTPIILVFFIAFCGFFVEYSCNSPQKNLYKYNKDFFLTVIADSLAQDTHYIRKMEKSLQNYNHLRQNGYLNEKKWQEKMNNFSFIFVDSLYMSSEKTKVYRYYLQQIDFSVSVFQLENGKYFVLRPPSTFWIKDTVSKAEKIINFFLENKVTFHHPDSLVKILNFGYLDPYDHFEAYILPEKLNIDSLDNLPKTYDNGTYQKRQEIKLLRELMPKLNLYLQDKKYFIRCFTGGNASMVAFVVNTENLSDFKIISVHDLKTIRFNF